MGPEEYDTRNRRRIATLKWMSAFMMKMIVATRNLVEQNSTSRNEVQSSLAQNAENEAY